MNKLELNRLRYNVSGARVVVEILRVANILGKYNPNQPRVPSGQREGGRWLSWDRGSTVAGPFNESNRAKCELQYESDMFQCSFGVSGGNRAACREQAMARYVACMKDLSIPGLIYLLGGVR